MAEKLATQTAEDPVEAFIERLREDLGREGFQRPLDDEHVATFVQRGPRLMVSFELMENALQVYGNSGPLGLDFTEDKGWSLLHIAARDETWFRSQAIYDFFDDLVDDCFFEDFDDVLFFGAGMGAYGACAYSVAAPGANIVAISPLATLDTDRAGWDKRFPEAKRLAFHDRYGYAPDMVEGASNVYILFDPFRALDYVHASLFRGPNIRWLKCRHLDGLIELALRELNILHQTVEAAANSDLTEPRFYSLLRERRTHARYLRTLLHALGRSNRPLRTAYLCQYVLKKVRGGPIFRRGLAQSKEIISRTGPLPDWLMDDEDKT